MPSPTMASEPHFGSLYGHFDPAQQQDQAAAHRLAYQQRLEDQQRLHQQLVAMHQQAAAAQRDAACQASRETTQYRDHNGLLAEAARRAQMAILTRDMGDFDLR
jgi:hypothetical protein